MSAHDAVLPVPVLILEDDRVIQTRLTIILTQLGYQLDTLIFVSNIAEANYILDQQQFSLALIDLGLPDGSGISIIERIREQNHQTLILVISAWSTQDSLFAAIKAGATGYVLKERDDTEVAFSIRSILRGGAPIDPFIAQAILKQIAENPEPIQALQEASNTNVEALTLREKEILTWVSHGLSNREIAD